MIELDSQECEHNRRLLNIPVRPLPCSPAEPLRGSRRGCSPHGSAVALKCAPSRLIRMLDRLINDMVKLDPSRKEVRKEEPTVDKGPDPRQLPMVRQKNGRRL